MSSHRSFAAAWWIVATVFVAAGVNQRSWSWLTAVVWTGWLASVYMAVLNSVRAEIQGRQETIV